MQNKISAIVTSSLPEFIQNDNQLFTLFIKYYFEWMETQDNFLEYIERFQDNIDLDRADDEYIDMFIDDFAETFPKNLYDNGIDSFTKVELTKSIREFYLAKGSESSIRFVFNLLHNTKIDFFYPREVLQKSSNCIWDSVDYSYCTASNISDLDIKFDSDIFAQGLSSGKTMVVDNITSSYHGSDIVMKLFISSSESGFIIGEEIQLTVDDVSIVETIIGGLDEIQVINGGSGYLITDEIIITDTTGSLATAKISTLGNGGYESYEIDNAGTGYIVGDLIYINKQLYNSGFGFIAEIMEIGGSGEIISLRIINNGISYSKTGVSNIKTSSGINAVITFTGKNVGKIKSISVFDSGIGYYDPETINISITSDNGVGFEPANKPSAVFSGVDRHLTQIDFPSNYSRIQDGYLYQNFSYVIMSNISPHKWINEIKRVVHPAGTVLFGMYVLESYVEAIINLPEIQTSIIETAFIIEGISSNEHMPVAGIQLMILETPVNQPHNLGLVYFDLDNTKLQSSWAASEFSNYTLDDVASRSIQEVKQEDSQVDTLFIYNNSVTYTIGQRVLHTDGNTYTNLIESTGIQPPEIGTWELESYSIYYNTVEYSLNDAILNGTDKYIYINVTPTTGTTPPNASYWALV